MELSSIFKWYKDDFSKGFKGYDSLESMVQKHQSSIQTKDGKQASIRPGTFKIKFIDYDWALNDVP